MLLQQNQQRFGKTDILIRIARHDGAIQIGDQFAHLRMFASHHQRRSHGIACYPFECREQHLLFHAEMMRHGGAELHETDLRGVPFPLDDHFLRNREVVVAAVMVRSKIMMDSRHDVPFRGVVC